jgi:putative membrane protein
MEPNMRLSLFLCVPLLAVAAPAVAASPADFVSDAIKGDNSEIMLGQMAQQQGASQGVRDFGGTLASDHTQAKEQMSSLAAAVGVTPSDQPMDVAREEKQKLSGMHGADFDREFARYMVKDHKEDLAKFRREARTDHGQVGQMAQQQIPVLEKHLHMAESLEKGTTR